jgi:tetratricopeptide (TPR) repeat protein
MFDAIPTQVWLLIAIAAAAFAPALYVYRHIQHSPRRRDITQPPEDLGWRTSGQLIRSSAFLAGLVTLTVFIFTPAAEKFARSPEFFPILMLGFSAFALLSVVNGFLKGRIEPLSRGALGPYERETQPKRFWASLSWNTILGGLFVWLAFVTIEQADEERCYDRQTVHTPQEELSACNELISRPGNTSEERADIFAARGYAYHRMGEYQKALADYDQAIGLDPADSYALYNRGLIYHRFGDRQRAIADYSASLKLRSDNAEGYLNRGLTFLDTGRLDEAIADFTRLHELEPDNQWALANRGIAYAWKQNVAAAERDFAAVTSIDPSNTVVLQGKALLSSQSGDIRAAVDHLTEALHLDPADAWSLRMRADLYWRLGEKEKSRDDDDRLLKLSEDAEKARADGAKQLTRAESASDS